MRESSTSDPANRTRTTDGEDSEGRQNRAGESARAAATRVSIIDAKLVGPYAPAQNAAPAEISMPVALGTIVRNRYELEEILGTGSMGAVYRARDHLHEEMQDAHPFVAIKILNEHFKRHPKALMALQRETRKAQTLAHENIVAVHNFDRDGALVFMTMELLDGQSLRTIVADNSRGLARDDAVPMIRGVARALAYAHDNGIVHCDLKPSNVFFTARRQIKVLDFGVARALPRQGANEPARAVDEGEVVGMTPAYASPQMLAGEDPAPSDDVFSLAIVCCELVTGRHPFDEQPVDEARLRELRSRSLPGLTRSQRRALTRALAREREARHQHAGEFLKDFEGPSSVRRVAYGSATAALVLPVSTFLMLSSPETGPDIAFEALPPQAQVQFNDAIAEGEMALGFGNAGVNDAFQFFSRAYELHPNNDRAVRGLEAVADRYLAFLPSADPATRHEALTLLQCHGYLGRYPPVAAACSALLGPEECRAIAASCRVVPRN